MRSQAKAASAGSTDGSGRGLGWAVLLVALLIALLGVSSAQAAPNYKAAGEFGNSTLSSRPTKIAVDSSTGNVYVVDSPNNRVLVYDSGGAAATLLTEFGSAELAAPFGIAIDQSNGDVYVSDAGHNRIARYTTVGGAPPTFTLDGGYPGPSQGSEAQAGQIGSFASPIAIDPTNGDLLVADTANLHVSRFDSSGGFLDSFNGEGSEGGVFTSLLDLVADSNGKIYVVENGVVGEFGGMTGSRVQRFAADGAGEESLGALGALDSARSIAFDPATGNVTVATGGGYLSLGGSPVLHVFHDGVTVGDVPFGGNQESPPVALAADGGTSGRVYGLTSEAETIYASPFGVAGVHVFAPVFVPEIILDPPAEVTSEGAHLSGTVDPGGEADTHYHFEYLADGAANWQETPDAIVPEEDVGGVPTPSDTPVGVSADLTGLVPNLGYQVRLVASNDEVGATSSAQTFSTSPVAPGVVTGEASDRTSDGTSLRGAINSFGLQSTYHFEYGTSMSYGSRAPADFDGVAGNGRAPRPVVQTVAGLEPETTYHYRLVAENSVGSSAGEDRTFTTQAGTAPKRAYELVSPAEKGGSNVDIFGSQASSDGKALAYLTKTPLAGQGTESAPLITRYVAQRSSSGWLSTPTDPPQNQKTLAFIFTLAVSDDGTKAVVISTKKLAPGAEEGDSNIYLRDVATGVYTTMATVPGTRYWANQVSFASVTQTLAFVAGTPNFDHVLLLGAGEEPVSFLPGVPDRALYEFTDGQLRVASVAPDGSPMGETPMVSTTSRDQYPLSEDGSRAVFTSAGSVYVRLNGATTQVISESHRASDAGTVQPGEFLGADRDGSHVYIFAKDLTDDSPSELLSLYRYTVATDELKFLTAATNSPFLSSGIPTQLQVGATGETVYFVANENLTGDGGAGIYVWKDGLLSQVAALSEAVDFLSRPFSWRASPNGRYLVFIANTKLTDYDTASSACIDFGEGESGVTCRQLYRYDAETGTVTCASCRPDGRPSTGRASIGADRADSGTQEFPRAVTNEGRVFFDTPDPLVSRDVNSVRDVYEYDGSDTRLISSGRNSASPSQLADASADGRDVFFTTQDRLVGIDTDNATDVYDARLGGGLASQNPPPAREECIRDDCKATPNAGPELPFGGSEGLGGPGNVQTAAKKRCGKGRHARKVKGKQRCVKQSKANRTNGNRRQGR